MATHMYIKFEDPAVKGSTSASEHKDEIEVLSWSHGFVQPTNPARSTAGGGTVEQATHQNLTFTKYLDAATQTILLNCWSGKQFKKATLTCYRADGAKDNKPEKYLEVAMQHVIISNYSISGGPGDLPVENVSLDYGIIQYNYVDRKKEDGSGPANLPISHDLEQRKVG